MHDIKDIRANPAAFDAAIARRKLAPLSAEILKLDESRRSAQTKLQELQNAARAMMSVAGARTVHARTERWLPIVDCPALPF